MLIRLSIPEGFDSITPAKVWVCCLATLWSVCAWAYPDVRFQHLTTDAGLSQSAIQAIAQDHQGYIWIGTQYGLDRYDGYEFRHFRHDPEDPDSLSNSNIASLLVARTGELWVLTRDGLNRMDPVTGKVERIKPDNMTSGQSLSGNSRVSMVEDPAGNIVIPAREGVYLWEAGASRLKALTFHPSLDDERLHGSSTVIMDQQRRFWLANSAGLWLLVRHSGKFKRVLSGSPDRARRGTHTLALTAGGLIAFADMDGLRLIDPQTRQVTDHLQPTRLGHSADRVDAVVSVPDGSLWLLLRQSLVRFMPETGHWETVASLPTTNRLVANRDRRLFALEDNQGYQWLSGFFGVGLYDPTTSRFRLFHHDPKDPESLTPTTINTGYSLFADDNGTLWIGGGLGGISRFVPQWVRFQRIRELTTSPAVANENIVRAVLEQSWKGQHRLWTGLDGAGLRLWEQQADGRYQVARKYHRSSPPEQQLPGNRVSAIVKDPENGNLWVATRSGLALIEPEKGLIQQHMRLDIPGSISNLLFSGDGQTLWASAGDQVYAFGLEDDRHGLRPRTRYRIHPDRKRDDSYAIFNLLETSSGDVLIATRMGLSLLGQEMDQPVHIFPGTPEREHPRNYIFALAESPEGTIWLGTRGGGLGRLELTGALPGESIPEIEWFDEDDGLADNTIYAILPDPGGHLWLSSNRGLMRFNPDAGLTRHYTHRDGVQDLEFNHGVAHIGPSGRYFFGGIRGVNAFRPDDIEDHPDPPIIQLQQVRVNGHSVDRTDTQPPELDLGHDENYLVIDFSGLHYVDPERIEYDYRLEGLESEWVEAGNRRQVRYPRLSPGQYRFMVRAANSDGVWSEDHVLLTATVRPPPWLTPAAYFVYFALAGLLIWLAVAMHFRRRLALEALVDQRTRELAEKTDLVERQARELEEALKARTILFANISHEFRTPITLIQATLDRLEDQGADAATVAPGKRYLDRLVRLVDQLLDLARLQTVGHRASATPWRLDRIVAMTTEAFEIPARRKRIDLVTDIEAHWCANCEQELVEKILLNLLSNAVKFTPEGGRISVRLEGHEGSTDQVALTVSDTGPGIAPDQQTLVFERFHRIEAAEHHHIQGAGIGLTLVREAAEALGGNIELESKPDQGTTFHVTLPAWKDTAPASEPEGLSSTFDADLYPLKEPGQPDSQAIAPSSPAGTALIVEDSRDLRAYIREIIADEWKVIEASDGKQALARAQAQMPDLVISDIMMPDMDGLELLKSLREDIRTSHLPVLLLTARQDDETRIRAFSLGADNYLTKPFDAGELRLRLRQMAERQRHMQAAIRRQLGYRQHPEADTADQDPGPTPRDRRLLDALEAWLHRHHHDGEIGITDMAKAMNMDTRTLQRKIKALTGETPAIHLRNYRLQAAAMLLETTDRTIQDIATACGFSSPQYFSRLFRQAYGDSPQAWRKQQ